MSYMGKNSFRAMWSELKTILDRKAEKSYVDNIAGSASQSAASAEESRQYAITAKGHADAAEAKLGEVSTAVETGKTAINSAKDTAVSSFNSNATGKTSAFDSNATEKTTAFNSNYTQKSEALTSQSQSIASQLDAKKTAIEGVYQSDLKSIDDKLGVYDLREVDGNTTFVLDGDAEKEMASLIQATPAYSQDAIMLSLEPVIPTSSAHNFGIKGQIAIDSDYLYVCVADNEWKKIPLQSL